MNLAKLEKPTDKHPERLTALSDQSQRRKCDQRDWYHMASLQAYVEPALFRVNRAGLETRTAIWLHVSAISSHQLGTCDLRMPGSEHQNLSEGAADGAPGLGDTAGMRAMLQQQQTELLQVQSMLLLHHERLLQLEASSAAHSNPTQRKLDDQLDATLH
ncbi:hypothetical protein WJX84_001431 [Apatococcus fuscideae]|uniref:Uncharacterized protein n=1 Tax=Apatococcus fuscideae TaxID=2026836 RepID=A0AAW1REG6_9CHLO